MPSSTSSPKVPLWEQVIGWLSHALVAACPLESRLRAAVVQAGAQLTSFPQYTAIARV